MQLARQPAEPGWPRLDTSVNLQLQLQQTQRVWPLPRDTKFVIIIIILIVTVIVIVILIIIIVIVIVVVIILVILIIIVIVIIIAMLLETRLCRLAHVQGEAPAPERLGCEGLSNSLGLLSRRHWDCHITCATHEPSACFLRMLASKVVEQSLKRSSHLLFHPLYRNPIW